MQAMQAKTITLILGGAGSGAARFAQQLVEQFHEVVRVKTRRSSNEPAPSPTMPEMDPSPSNWVTVEESEHLVEALAQHGPSCEVILIDSLTQYAANLVATDGATRAAMRAKAQELCQAVQSTPCSVVLVSSEAPGGDIPDFEPGGFPELLGELNQCVARIADDVLLMVAGLPLAIKGHLEVSL